MEPQLGLKTLVYLAEDDEDDRILFLDAVEDLALPVSVVQLVDGKQLIDTLNLTKELPEIIFLDINMPFKNGLECLKEIRSSKGDLKYVKVIMLSTSSSSIHIEFSYKLGADFYAVKPGTFQGLKELLEKVFYEFKNLGNDMKKFILTL